MNHLHTTIGHYAALAHISLSAGAMDRLIYMAAAVFIMCSGLCLLTLLDWAIYKLYKRYYMRIEDRAEQRRQIAAIRHDIIRIEARPLVKR